MFVVQDTVAEDEALVVETPEIVRGLSTLTVVEAVEVLLFVSVDKAQSVVEPFGTLAVFQGTEYRVVPDAGVVVELMRVDVAILPR